MIFWILLLFLFEYSSELDCSETATPACATDEYGGDDYKVWRFRTIEDCESEINPIRVQKYSKGCKTHEETGFNYKTARKTKCLSSGYLRVIENCLHDKECEECNTKKYIGKGCSFYNQDDQYKYYERVEGCGIGADGSVVMTVGGIMMFIGFCFFLCCLWICIPLGLAILLIGVCVGCC